MDNNTSSALCSGCGCKIFGQTYTHNKAPYCYACVQKIQDSILQEDDKKSQLLAYIKRLFYVQEIPVGIMRGIDKELNEKNMTISGIMQTMYYFYELKENPHSADNIQYLCYTLQCEYENARRAMRNLKEIKERNRNVDLSVEPINITINPKMLNRKPVSFDYDMADL